MIILKDLPESSVAYLITFVPIIVYVIKLTIDNWGITELEKIRLSNIKKFQITLTKYVFLSITFVAAMFIMLVLSDQFEEIKGNLIYGMLAFFFIIFIVATFIAEKLIRFVANLLSFRYDYHIVNDEGVPVYRIIKLSSNNSLLVESDGIEEFLDNKENRRYKKIRNKNKILEEFYGSKKSMNSIIGLAILSFGFLVLVLVTTDWWQFVYYLVFITALLFTLILLLNYIENKRYNDSLQGNSDNAS
ncbi:hypothetical protein H9650_11285 [Psychrobacillus sp. Sa2BUA9]|uniref:Uncharacterized protein n=1 Tax=Psychrobacillus faecigallinarum TaxID=2762235 RepID=A0ABR8RA93_9BACI|nr:hypothetical protein [Psychrobacillus faecigallinarum]MBD7944698.1 hypothetical protein [Psychrobacillus faecigallinarum]